MITSFKKIETTVQHMFCEVQIPRLTNMLSVVITSSCLSGWHCGPILGLLLTGCLVPVNILILTSKLSGFKAIIQNVHSQG